MDASEIFLLWWSISFWDESFIFLSDAVCVHACGLPRRCATLCWMFPILVLQISLLDCYYDAHSRILLKMNYYQASPRELARQTLPALLPNSLQQQPSFQKDNDLGETKSNDCQNVLHQHRWTKLEVSYSCLGSQQEDLSPEPSRME